jgi:RNA polymerase primary sigma factor
MRTQAGTDEVSGPIPPRVHADGSREPDTMIATAHDHRLESTAAPRAAGRPGLTRDEEVELATRAAAGDRMARDRMVEANLGLVHTIARDFQSQGLDLEDLIGEGHLGLFRAVERFDPRFGARFSTYAAHWIKEAIRAALIDTAPVVRLPAWMVRLLTRWRRAERALRRETGRAPGFEEVAAALGLSEEQKSLVSRALEARRLRAGSGSGDEAAGCRLAEIRDRRGRVEERAELEDERAMMRRRMGRLDERERTILALRYGLEGEAVTLKEIGRRLGMTREWARKLELRALGKLGDS